MMTRALSAKILAVVVFAVGVLALSTLFADWAGAACQICSGPSPVHCVNANPLGYVNCSASGSSCYNGQPLCETSPQECGDVGQPKCGWPLNQIDAAEQPPASLAASPKPVRPVQQQDHYWWW